MKRSELKAFIKEEINLHYQVKISTEDIKDTEELTKAVADLAKAKEEAGLSEENIGLADIEEMGFEAGEQAFENIKSDSKINQTTKHIEKDSFKGI
jgi:hypothetical protein